MTSFAPFISSLTLQVASQVGALDAGYTAGLTPDTLRSAKCLYLLGAVSLNTHTYIYNHTKLLHVVYTYLSAKD